MGDGESAEGSVWEAASFSSHYKLDNLVAIVDVNRLGQSQPTALQHDMETYRKRFDALGFKALVVDGHNIQEIYRALHTAKCTKDHCPAVPHLERFVGVWWLGVRPVARLCVGGCKVCYKWTQPVV